MERFGRTVVIVPEYEEALSFYRDKLGLDVLYDAPYGDARALHVGFASNQSGIWLIRATTPEQTARIGNQTGGQPLGVFYTNDIVGDVARFRQHGVELLGEIVNDDGERHCQFRDLLGNRWVLVQLRN